MARPYTMRPDVTALRLDWLQRLEGGAVVAAGGGRAPGQCLKLGWTEPECDASGKATGLHKLTPAGAKVLAAARPGS